MSHLPCSEMIFLDRPIEERVRRISELGLQVEIWDWTKHDIDALIRTGATISFHDRLRARHVCPRRGSGRSCCACGGMDRGGREAPTARASTCTAPDSIIRVFR